MRPTYLSKFARLVGASTVALFLSISIFPQKLDSIERGRAVDMLKNVKSAIKKNYYDPQLGGMDIEARFKLAEEKLKTAETIGQAYGIIAQAVLDLNDSHTKFYPPDRSVIVEYGWRIKMFGDKAFISAVKDGSDADKKGLRVGDEVLKLNGFRPTRRELWKMNYYYHTLSPRAKVVFEVRSPDAEARQLEVESKLTQLKKVIDLESTLDVNVATREYDKVAAANKHYFREFPEKAVIWQMPDFVFDPNQVDSFMSKALDKQALILDLRGNGGGYVATLEKLAGYFFEKDVKIADYKARKKMDPQMARSVGARTFKGKVIVLVDAESGSAAEIFARLMQIEKRGIVLGDVSSGSVMMSMGETMDAGGGERVVSYGMNLTRADVIMTDGKSLEHVGVQPDEVIIPTAQDLARRHDPVLARALELAGIIMTSADAGKLLPPEKFVERKSHLLL